ncbi:MAG TPA: hypothetical protein VGB04_12235 [Allosphingosinicella sp.]
MKALLPALLLAVAPGPSFAQRWNCTDHVVKEEVESQVQMSFWGPGRPVLPRPYISIRIRGFSYAWKPRPRFLQESFRDPAEMAFPLRTRRDPVRGSVVLTAAGERPIKIPVVGGSLRGTHVYHGPYLALKDRRAVARLLSVPLWTATVRDRRGRTLEVTRLATPAREELRRLYDAARARMIEAARDPAHSPSCDIDRTEETI